MVRRIAIVHDSFLEYGGAERVMASIVKLFPEADIFTSTYDNQVIKRLGEPMSKKKIRTSWYHYFPIPRKWYFLQLFAPLIWSLFSLSKYDLVITSSTEGLSNLARVSSNARVDYVHSVPKSFWGMSKRKIIHWTQYGSIYRKWYISSLKKSGCILVNSKHTKKAIELLIGKKNLQILYPPVSKCSTTKSLPRKDYFLTVSRLDPQKNIEIAIQACNELNKKLYIVGTSLYKSYIIYLKSIAGPSIIFLGFVSRKKLCKLYLQAKALIHCAYEEDFGIAPVEAMMHGTPVIAYNHGGIKDTVITGKTGLLYKKHTPSELAKTINSFENISFDRKLIKNNALRFSEIKFHQQLYNLIKHKFSNEKYN